MTVTARATDRCTFCGSAQHALADCRMPGVVAFRAEQTNVPSAPSPKRAPRRRLAPVDATTEPTAAPTVTARRWCGIDPGQDVGLCAVSVPGDGARMHSIERGRLIGHAIARETSSKRLTNAAAKSSLYTGVLRLLTEWRITDVVIEEPSDVTRSWKGAAGQKVRGQSTGTVFWQGAHYGLCLAAARQCPTVDRLWAYPPTTPKRSEKKERDTGEPVRGWMQGYATVPTPRTLTLSTMAALLNQLKQRPESGVLPTLDELRADVSEHERMALGVLNYHLHRECGRR